MSILSNRRMVLRCDGSATIGLGHLSRCVALGQRLQSIGADCVFASRELPPGFDRRLRGLGFPVEWITGANDEDRRETARLATVDGVVVTDSHRFTAEYYRELAGSVSCVLSFDDIALGPYSSHIVVNPNVGANRFNIEVAPTTRVLKGPAYFPLRQEFDSRCNSREIGEVRHAVVSIGGMPPPAMAIQLARAMARLYATHGVRTTVVAGLMAPPDQIAQMADALGVAGEVVVDPEMPELLGSADIAVVNGSTTALEGAAIGLPLMVVGVAENQVSAIDAYRRTGDALVIDRNDIELSTYDQSRRLITNPSLRQDLSQRGRALVDGHGHQRIIDAVATHLTHLTRSSEWSPTR